MRKAILACVAAILLSRGIAAVGDHTAEWNALVDEYLDKVYFPLNPTVATASGIHRYDGEIEDYSESGRSAEIRTLHAYETRVAQFPADGLQQVDAADRQMLLGAIRSELLTLEKIKPLEKNPDVYSGGLTNGVYVLMNRKFAPAEERLRSVIQRERKMPDILTMARVNLKDSPRVYTDIAIEQLPGIISFFEKDVPGAFAGVTDAELKADFAKANANVISSQIGRAHV